MKSNEPITFEIVNDTFPPGKQIKEYEKHCVTYLIHNNTQIYIGETSNLKSRFKDHVESKKGFKFIHTKIITSKYFHKSAIYDIESRLINYFFADNKFDVANIKTLQSSHNYYLKERINNDFIEEIWERLRKNNLVLKSIREIENSHLFKYSPFKEFSEEQLNIIDSITKLTTYDTKVEGIAYDGSATTIRKFQDKGKSVLLRGGPGTGKTLLIIKLVHDLIKLHLVDSSKIAICIPQSNLLKTFKVMLKQSKTKVRLLRPVEISRLKDKELDLLIVDETHRLKQHFNKQTKDLKHLQNGKYTELDFALAKSKHLVMLYDSNQTVRPADLAHVSINKIKFDKELQLTQQFRIKKGSDYLRFLQNLLQISSDTPSAKDIGDYDIKIFDSLHDLKKTIDEKEKEFKLCRMASGYFVEWISKKNSKAYDFEKEGLKLQWNTSIERWAHSENAPNEVGCIHTLQGEDLNYAGVIVGDDLYFDPKDKKIKIRKEKFFDKNGTPINGTDEGNIQLTKYIKNTYYVLLSRGMLGTYLYIKDPELKNYLQGILRNS